MAQRHNVSRRRFLETMAATAWLAGMESRGADSSGELPPVRQLTSGPKFHWFSYYDKYQFDQTDRYVLSMEVDFEHRSPRADDVVRIGMIDLRDNDRWIELGTSTAWCWQQGCMLQWLPGSDTEIIWNDRQDDHYVCHVLNVTTRAKRTLPHPIYTISPDGRWAVSPDFRRINEVRPGYGYAGIDDPHRKDPAPGDSGIFRIDLTTGDSQLIVTLADLAAMPFPGKDLTRAKHWFNHLLVSPDGSRFEFLHRWRNPGQKGFDTRMCTAGPDGSDVRIIDPSGFTSHFIWRDPQQILAWSRAESHGDAFYLFEDKAGGRIEVVGPGVMTENGHCSYLPGSEWILNDTYPDRQRNQNVYVYHVPSGRRVWLGHFASPKDYRDEWRCDTHPRFSRDGRSVVIDSAHGSQGRQLYLIDISRIVS
jgi:hypothetical protein